VGAPGVGPNTESPRFLVVGTVRRPHGVRGEVSVAVDTDRPKSIFRAGRVLTVGDTKGRAGTMRLTLERSRPFKDGLLLKFSEFDSLNPQLEALRGATLLMPEAEVPPLGEGEVYYHQLVGLRVMVGADVVGTVAELMELPGAETLLVKRAGKRDLMIPFISEWIRRLDVAEGVIEIDPPEGLLEL
jgi:16S rRNA processing protein RimM